MIRTFKPPDATQMARDLTEPVVPTLQECLAASCVLRELDTAVDAYGPVESADGPMPGEAVELLLARPGRAGRMIRLPAGSEVRHIRCSSLMPRGDPGLGVVGDLALSGDWKPVVGLIKPPLGRGMVRCMSLDHVEQVYARLERTHHTSCGLMEHPVGHMIEQMTLKLKVDDEIHVGLVANGRERPSVC
jgi:hypothetical protein